ncbi:hypothetical protein [Halobacteriovorax sp. DA5]|uniref:hypothetical protein n=1 Tax=Halobacteriovorax sp. DA5 TaxID=2067553 RepID=UPI000CD2164D|nr:hypothetical protein [Halobacteriovorax sp. DA5]POB13619.1 hypothetical protein C0Z22_10670 [Halobacteriovorax sp. DA5]
MYKLKKNIKNNPVTVFEIIVSITLCILSIALFTIQIVLSTGDTTGTETALFNLLQFLITIGFSWFTARVFSKLDFEKNMKKFAISAYRRIKDIEKINNRLHSTVKDMLTTSKTSDQTNLLVIEAIVHDASNVVRSSIDDWGDVIGEELIILEQIRNLEHKKIALKNSGEIVRQSPLIDEKSALASIEEKLDTLKSDLPSLLQISSTEMERPLEYDPDYALFLLSKKYREDDNRLTIKCVAGPTYSVNIKIEDVDFMQHGLVVKRSQGGSMDLYDKKGNILARVLNPLPFAYDQGVETIEYLFNKQELPVKFLKIVHSYEVDDDNYVHCLYEILADPVRCTVSK